MFCQFETFQVFHEDLFALFSFLYEGLLAQYEKDLHNLYGLKFWLIRILKCKLL